MITPSGITSTFAGTSNGYVDGAVGMASFCGCVALPMSPPHSPHTAQHLTVSYRLYDIAVTADGGTVYVTDVSGG